MILFFVAGILLLGWGIARAVFGGWHHLRRRMEKTICASAYRSYASEVEAGRQWLLSQPCEGASVRSFDGLKLVGRFISCPNPRGTALLFHGWHSVAELDFSCISSFYHEIGLNLLLVDQRGQGDSQGKFITFGVRESRDVEAWVQWHTERFHNLPILLCGVSMGASTVLMAAGQPLPAQVRGVIADCGFTTPYEIMKTVAGRKKLPLCPTMGLLRVISRLFAGFGLWERSAEDCRLPVLLIHGEADRFVPCDMGRRIFQNCRSPDKELLLVAGAGHAVSYLVKTQAYQTKVRDFVDRILKG